MKHLILLTTVLLLSARSEADDFPTTNVFSAGKDGYKVYRIPAIIKAANDDLLAFCEARQGGDASEIDLVLKRSSDSGNTWGKIEIVQESDNFQSLFEAKATDITIGNPAPVVDLLNPENPGRTWLPFTLENDRVFIVYSDDHGVTWSDRREITRDVKKDEWGWYATGPVHSIQIQNGPHRGRIVIPSDHRIGDGGTDRGANGAHAIISDDHGQTWRLGAVDDTYEDGLNANETAVVELNDGTLYFNTRDQNGKAPGTRGETWSKDGGETFFSGTEKWQGFRPVEGVLDPPVVQCSLLRVSDDLILFSGPTGKGRSDMRIRYSMDQAKTWQNGPLIHTGPAAYSDMVLLESETVGLLFEAGDAGQKSAYQRIDFVTLEQSAIVAEDSIVPKRPTLTHPEETPGDLLPGGKPPNTSGQKISGVPVAAILEKLGATMERNVTPEQLKDLSRRFASVDRDRDGRHSKTEYIGNGHYLTPQARAGIFNAADSNKDEFVTKAEYILNRIITDEAKTLVQSMDDGRDGVIQRSEFLHHATPKLSDSKLAEEVFEALDTNRNGVIIIPEYLRVWGIWAREGRKSPGQRVSDAGKSQAEAQ